MKIKFFSKIGFFFIFLFIAFDSFLFSSTIFKKVIKDFKKATDSYSKIVKINFNVVVFPFDSVPSILVKENIYEKFLEELVDSRIYRVVDRQNLEKMVEEKKLEMSGLIDSDTCKVLEKVLGVDAIIVGKIFDIDIHKLGINFKLIKSDTMEVLAVSYIELYKSDFLFKKDAYKESGYNDILIRERQLAEHNRYKNRVKKHISVLKSNSRSSNSSSRFSR